MRIGVFGGTFDPPHVGHLVLAERCREGARLDAVWFVPSFRPPHKAGRELTRFSHRCDMVTLATTGQPAFRVEPVEAELPAPSYTVQTLAALRALHPADEFALILGADSVHDLPHWHEPAAVVAGTELVVVARPGVELWDAGRLAAELGLPIDAVRVTPVECPLLDVSSRDVRRRSAAGLSIRFVVPRAVEEFVRDKKLYPTP